MKLLARKKQADREIATLRLYYASDVHGSDQCWRKFLGAAGFYKADAAIMGGDLTGKAIVPITQLPDGTHQAQFLGEDHRLTSPAQLSEFEDAVRYNGFYPLIAPAENLERYAADEASRSRLFDLVIERETRRWVTMADKRIAAGSSPVYVIAGNDDPWCVDKALGDAKHVIAADDRVVRVGPHEMISCSYANPTPWASPRELPESELYTKIKRLAEQLEAPEQAIFNLHVPPYDTGIDTAAKLTGDLQVVTEGGAPVEAPVGSTAVRELIEEYQPLLALHGHIHESRGIARLGRTLCINSGSEYNSGRIHGVIVDLTEVTVARHQFVIG